MVKINYEGLREMAQSLAVVNQEMYGALVAGLAKVGDLVRDDAARRFIEYGADGSAKRAEYFLNTASNFETRVRPLGSKTALVVVGQRLRSSRDPLKRRPNYGDLEMRHGFIPARSEKLAEAALLLETEVGELLRVNGF